MTSLLMPKATAVWLIDNTSLTFEQIAEFCSIHVLEVQAIADGDVGQGILGFDPILNGQLTKDEIDKIVSLVTDSMMGAANLDVPLEIDIGIGDNWDQAH